MQGTNLILPPSLTRLRSLAPIAGGAGLLLGVVLAFLFNDRDLFFQAYLYGYMLWLALALGPLAFLMIHHLTGGAWSFVSQRVFEAGTRTLPVMAVGFLPILAGPWGLHDMYHGWTDPDLTEAVGAVVAKKAAYLNPLFWTVRAIIYFAVWIFIAQKFNGWSCKLEETGDVKYIVTMRRFSPICLLAYCVTTTLAATDWLMSLEPGWFSTIYGPLFWIGQGLTTLAFTILILTNLDKQKPMSQYLTIEPYHHLSNLLLGFTVLWAYMSFAQYLIIWSGNLPEEIHYYLARKGNGMTAIAILLMAGHFGAPFFLLLFRRMKLELSNLQKICCWILVMRMVDMFWVTNPAFHHEAPGLYLNDILVDLALFVGLGGVWLYFFFNQLSKSSMLALKDPRLYEALGHGNQEAAEHA